MKIGEAIQVVSRNESECLRIINSVVEGIGKPSEIYNKYSQLNKNKSFWTFAQKRLKITGFRPNMANNIILSKIFQGIEKNNKTCIFLFWELYSKCVIDFIHNEHSNLNQLLLDKEMEGDADSTDGIIKAIMKFIALYEVGTEQIEELYEAWWFDRTENLYDIFSTQELSLDIVREIVLKSERKQTREIESLNKNICKLESIIKRSINIVRYEKDVEELVKKYENLKDDFDVESSKNEKRYVDIIDGNVSVIGNKIEENERVGGNNKNENSLEDKINRNEKNINRINDIVNLLTNEKKEEERKEKERKKNKKIFKNNAVMKDNLSKIFDDCKCGDNNSELLISVLNSFGSFYIESEILFRAISQDLITKRKVKEIVADPAMIDFPLLTIKGLQEFDVVYIKNIKACFIEGSIIPILLRANSLIDKNFPKIFILHDYEVNSSVSSKIKSHTIDISYEWLAEIKNINISSSTKEAVISDIVEVTTYHREMQRILENSGVRIDQQIFERFVRLFHLLTCHLDERQSLKLSAQGVLYPYIISSYGDIKAQVIIEILNGIV